MSMPFQKIDLRLYRCNRGFTLIELMIVVAVIAVLAAVALPAYFDSVRKSRRADAITGLNRIAQEQERWRANQPQFAAVLMTPSPSDCDTLAEQVANSCLRIAAVAGAYYTYVLSATSATTYTVTATGIGPQASDSKCTTLTLTMNVGQIIYGSTGTATPAKCWNR